MKSTNKDQPTTNRAKLSRRKFLSLAALSLSGVALAACQQSQAPTSPGAPATTPAPAAPAAKPAASAASAGRKVLDKFVVAQDTDIQRFDCTTDIRSQDRNVYGHVLEQLVHRTPAGKVQPWLATKWEWSSDARTLRFSLRDDVKFANGDPLTAEDVKYSMDRLRDPKISDGASNFRAISGVDVIDPTTVEFKLEHPDASQLGKIIDSFFVAPAKAHAAAGDNWNKNPIGSGPYRLVEWVKGDHITMEARPDYWGKPAPAKQVIFRVIPEPTTQAAALISGELDLAMSIASTQVDLIKNSGKAEVKTGPSPEITYVASAMDNPILKNEKVRVAIAHAINVKPLVDVVLGGYATQVGTLLIPGMVGYDPPLPGIPYDPAKAKQLLAEAGYPDGFEIPFDTQIGRVARGKDVAEAIAQDLAKVGINAKLTLYEEAAFTAKKYRREGQKLEGLFLYIIRAPAYDPDQLMGTAWHSKGAWNYGHFGDPTLDAKIEKGVATLDDTERAKIYRDAAAQARDTAYWVNLYARKTLYGVATGKDFSWSPRQDEMIWVHFDVTVG